MQKCPKCNSEMKQRKGKWGDFWGCTKYPQCRGIVNIKPESPYKKQEPSNPSKPTLEERVESLELDIKNIYAQNSGLKARPF